MSLTDTEVSKAWATSVASPEAAERAEATGKLQLHFVDTGEVRDMMKVMPQGHAEAQNWIAEAEKAIVNRAAFGIRNHPKPGDRTTLDSDPLEPNIEIPGLRSRRWRAPGVVLREMTEQSPLLQSIISNFNNRTLSHASAIQPGQNAVLNQPRGWDIVRLGKPAYEALTDDEVREKGTMIEFLENSGDLPRFNSGSSPTSEDLGRDPMRNFLSKITYDRFTLDAIAIELARTRGQRLSGYYVVDGDRVFKTQHPDWPYGRAHEVTDDKARFAEVYQRRIVNTFRANEMFYSFSNARAGLRYNGYGISEVEMSMRLTTGILNVITNSNSQFDRNAMPPGFLAMYGYLNEEALMTLQQQYNMWRLDPGGSFGLPLVAFREANAKLEYINMSKGPKDMEFQHYTNFLYAVTCAIFGVDVVEVNGSTFGGQNAGLNSGKDTKARMDDSRDRGFIPWMHTAQEVINAVMSPLFGSRWRFAWCGLVRGDEQRLWEAYQASHTTDEVRMGLFGSQPLGGMIGNVPLSNPAISQLVLAAAKSGVEPGGTLGESLQIAPQEPGLYGINPNSGGDTADTKPAKPVDSPTVGAKAKAPTKATDGPASGGGKPGDGPRATASGPGKATKRREILKALIALLDDGLDGDEDEE